MKAKLASGAGSVVPGAAGDALSSLGDGGLFPGLSIAQRFKYFIIGFFSGIGFAVLAIMFIGMLMTTQVRPRCQDCSD